MEKKIMILSGSPRKRGNTNTAVNWFAEVQKNAPMFGTQLAQ